jgi:hypothetical protein
MLTTETAGSRQERSGAVSPLVGVAPLPKGDRAQQQ